MEASTSTGSATYLTIAIKAWNSAAITMPHNTRVTMDRPPTSRLAQIAAATAASPPAKAAACTATGGRCSNRASEAPKPAPADTPSKAGEAMGLRNRAW